MTRQAVPPSPRGSNLAHRAADTPASSKAGARLFFRKVTPPPSVCYSPGAPHSYRGALRVTPTHQGTPSAGAEDASEAATPHEPQAPSLVPTDAVVYVVDLKALVNTIVRSVCLACTSGWAS